MNDKQLKTAIVKKLNIAANKIDDVLELNQTKTADGKSLLKAKELERVTRMKSGIDEIIDRLDVVPSSEKTEETVE